MLELTNSAHDCVLSHVTFQVALIHALGWAGERSEHDVMQHANTSGWHSNGGQAFTYLAKRRGLLAGTRR